MKFPAKFKKFKQPVLVFTAIAVISAVLFFGFTDVSFGQTPSSPPPVLKDISTIKSTTGFIATDTVLIGLLFAFALIMVAVKGFFVWMLSLVSGLLNVVFRANTDISLMAADGVSAIGWTIMRDAANSFFLILVLWVALTIIFNLESLGGKQLLYKILIVALLINFSLAFVAAAFGVTNLLAKPFSEKIKGVGGVGTYVADRTKLMTIQEEPTSEAVKNMKERYSGGGCQSTDPLGIDDCDGGAVASLVDAAKGVSPIWWFLSEEHRSDKINQVVGRTVVLLISIILLIIALVALTVGVFMLTARLAAALILSILAPAAFLMFIIPGNIGKGLFDKWLHALFKWAIFAPAFYFFIYAGLYYLGNIKIDPTTPILANPEAILALITVSIFFIAAVIVARSVSDKVAGMATGALKIAGLGALAVAAIPAGAAAAGAASRMAPMALKATGAVSRTPVLGKALAPATRKIDQYFAGRRGKIDQREKEAGALPAEMRANEFRRSVDADTKIGNALSLAKEGKFGLLKKGEQEQAITLAGRYGEDLQMRLLKSRPDLASPQNVRGATTADAAMKRVTEQMKPEDIRNLDLEGKGTEPMDPEIRKDIIRNVIITGNPEKLKELSELVMRMPSETRKDVQLQMDAVVGDQNTWNEIEKRDPDMHNRYLRYLMTNPGRAVMSASRLPSETVRKMNTIWAAETAARKTGRAPLTTTGEKTAAPEKPLIVGWEDPERVREKERKIIEEAEKKRAEKDLKRAKEAGKEKPQY